MGLNLKILKMSPALFAWRYIRKALRTRLIISLTFLFVKTLRTVMTLWRRYEVWKYTADAILFRETQWNPGPCGAGACVFPPGVSEPVLLKQPVSSRGSILLGEVVAIKMALQYLYRYKTQKPSDLRKVHIFSDSQSAVGQLTLGKEAKSHRTTTQEVKSEINRLQD